MGTQKMKNGTVIDVRSAGEFYGGHAQGAVNIPLNELPQRLNEVKVLKTPLVLCCASGNRSGQAQQFLMQQGIECLNAGPWTNCCE
ncbi:MAG: rhodanese-like domain-containing protein [Bacteroidetes bacterium]|nr:rhodanese-like domain-containing protein [Bacteroidota bacterium]